jgi:hypothetical protein
MPMPTLSDSSDQSKRSVSRSDRADWERHFRRAVAEFVEHYHRERNTRASTIERGADGHRQNELRATPLAARRAPQFLSVGRVTNSAELWNFTGSN